MALGMDISTGQTTSFVQTEMSPQLFDELDIKQRKSSKTNEKKDFYKDACLFSLK